MKENPRSCQRRTLPRLPSGWLATATVLAWHLSAATALAQRPGRLPGEDKGFLQWVVAIGIALLVAAAGFMNAKRSHQN